MAYKFPVVPTYDNSHASFHQHKAGDLLMPGLLTKILGMSLDYYYN